MINDVAAYHIPSYFYIFNQRQYILMHHKIPWTNIVIRNNDGLNDEYIYIYMI